jgi:transketolase C-terminal domain/subunit
MQESLPMQKGTKTDYDDLQKKVITIEKHNLSKTLASKVLETVISLC